MKKNIEIKFPSESDIHPTIQSGVIAKLKQRIEHLSPKTIRLLFGLVMMYAFIFIVEDIYFFAKIALNYNNSVEIFIWSGIIYSGFWIPNLLLIGITYIILIKVYPYQPAK